MPTEGSHIFTVHRGISMVAIAAFLVLAGFVIPEPVQAWYRFYGNVNIAWQNAETTQQFKRNDAIVTDTAHDGSFRQSGFFNYEDSLPAKSTARLALNIDRRENTYTHRTTYRPIWYLDINNLHIGLRSSYSGYTLGGINDTLIVSLDSTGGITDTAVVIRPDVYNREIRFSGATKWLSWPNWSLAYSRVLARVSDTVARSRSVNTHVTSDVSWFKDWLSIRGGHSRVDRHENVYLANAVSETSTMNRNWNGIVAVTNRLGSAGSMAATYNIYRTRYASPNAIASRSLTHTASTIVSSKLTRNVTGSASYSGRFAENNSRLGRRNDKSESFSSHLVWTPVNFLDFSALKSYQIEREGGASQHLEYFTTTAQSSRFLRSGIDTRFSWSRTWYQQSSRTRQIASGDTIVTRAVPHYYADTWYGAVDGSPFRYTRTRYTVTVTRDSDPIRSDQRWQFTQSVDVTANVSRRINGRFTATTLYQGDRLRIGHVYSKNFNAGLNWFPEENINASLSYTWSVHNTYLRFVNETLGGTLSYRFRRAFSFYFTAHRQEQPGLEYAPESSNPVLTKNVPTALNAQLQLFLTQRTTAIIGYIVSRSDHGSPKLESRSRTWLASVNMQM